MEGRGGGECATNHHWWFSILKSIAPQNPPGVSYCLALLVSLKATMLVLVVKGGYAVGHHVILILAGGAGSRWAGEGFVKGTLPGGSKGHALSVEVKWNIFTPSKKQ